MPVKVGAPGDAPGLTRVDSDIEAAGDTQRAAERQGIGCLRKHQTGNGLGQSKVTGHQMEERQRRPNRDQ
jgi:hypothetical protein